MVFVPVVNNPDRESVDAWKFIGVMFEYFVWMTLVVKSVIVKKFILVFAVNILLVKIISPRLRRCVSDGNLCSCNLRMSYLLAVESISLRSYVLFLLP